MNPMVLYCPELDEMCVVRSDLYIHTEYGIQSCAFWLQRCTWVYIGEL